MFELVDSAPQNAVIKVVGVGGGGGNAVRHMIDREVDGVDFICANTDAQALSDIHSKTVLQLGASITKGLGAGANPEVGRAAALEDKDRIADALHGADMVFVTAGMGGGTGTGAAPIVAEVAREMGILTVAVVTRPFSFEGKRRLSTAEEGLKEIAQHCDSLVTCSESMSPTSLGFGGLSIRSCKIILRKSVLVFFSFRGFSSPHIIYTHMHSDSKQGGGKFWLYDNVHSTVPN